MPKRDFRTVPQGEATRRAWVDGYQSALFDLALALAAGGPRRVAEWIVNNSHHAETRQHATDYATAPALTLTADEQAVILSALEDAAYYRDVEESEACAFCDRAEGGTCEDHDEDHRKARAYVALAAKIKGDQ